MSGGCCLGCQEYDRILALQKKASWSRRCSVNESPPQIEETSIVRVDTGFPPTLWKGWGGVCGDGHSVGVCVWEGGTLLGGSVEPVLFCHCLN